VCLNTSTKMSSSTYALLFRNREGPSPWLTPRNIANMSRLCMAVSVECRSASVYGLWKLDGCCVPSQIPISLSIPPPPPHSFMLFITYIVSRIDRYSSAYYFRNQLCNTSTPRNNWFFFSSTQPVCSAYSPATRQHASESLLSVQGCGKYMRGGTHPLYIYFGRCVYTHSYSPPFPLLPSPLPHVTHMQKDSI
jgi:hypothetical protein